VDPYLVLHSEAAGCGLLQLGRKSFFRETPRGLLHVSGGAYLDAQVVEGTRHPIPTSGWVLDQDQLEWGFSDDEIGITGPALGGLGGEELGVEVDRSVDVRDVESKLYTSHGRPPLALMTIDTLSMLDTFTNVNGRRE
jgi:hypothetical protein